MYYNIHQHLMDTFPTVQKNAGPDYPYHYPASRLSLDYLMQLPIKGYFWFVCLRHNLSDFFLQTYTVQAVVLFILHLVCPDW